MSFSPSPNILPNRSNGYRKGLLARMSHRVSLLGKKKLEAEICIRSVLYIASEALRSAQTHQASPKQD